MRLTIGMPVYNSDRWIGAALDSLLGQSYTEFRLVISDNASTDATRDICMEKAQSDPRVRYNRQPENIGVFRNYDFVFEGCDTEFFKWASANDICGADMLASCIRALDENPDAVIAFPQTVLFDDDSDFEERYPDFARLESDDPIERFRCFHEEVTLNNLMNGVIRSDALRRTSLNRVYIGSDLNMTAELLLQGRVALIERPLFFRRMSAESSAAQRSHEDRDAFYSHEPESTDNWQVSKKALRAIVGASRAPRRWSTKRRATLHALRMLMWKRHAIWHEVLASMRVRRARIRSDS